MDCQINGLVEVSGFDIYEALQKAKAMEVVYEKVDIWAAEQSKKEWKSKPRFHRFRVYIKGLNEGYYTEYYTLYYKYHRSVVPRSYRHLQDYFEVYINNKTQAFREVNKLFMSPNNKYLLTPDQAQFVKDFKDIVIPSDMDTAMKINSFKGEKK